MWGVLGLFLTGMVGILLVYVLTGHDRRALPVYSVAPEFSMTERSGKQVTLAVLRGKVWVADFFFSHCKDFCPLQTAQMARLQKEFMSEKDFRLVSYTIDPDRDSLEALRIYANRYQADPVRWLFLRGSRKETHTLVKEGFRLSIAISDEYEPSRDPQSGLIELRKTSLVAGTRVSIQVLGWLQRVLRRFEPRVAWAHHQIETDSMFTHSSRFVLVDREAKIRGYYHSDDPEYLRKIRLDARSLLSG